jgi:hypothetical protein
MSRWFRFYDDSLNNRKVQSLPPDLFKHWVNILCIASKHGGVIPSLAEVSFCLRMTDAKAALIIAALSKRALLDPVDGGYFRPHDWDERQYKSDISNDRVKRHRERKRNAECNVTEAVTVTPPETEAEAETETEAEADQPSSTHLPNTSSQRKFCEDVKSKGWTPPKHCAVSSDKKWVYIEKNTSEWEAYAADYRSVHKQEPQPNAHGGKWFSALGEAA